MSRTRRENREAATFEEAMDYARRLQNRGRAFGPVVVTEVVTGPDCHAPVVTWAVANSGQAERVFA
ncbi:MAG TPA: hypothetical protein VFL96_08930 [Acidobacteriaceae bacterium]|nr:hypothetical protein [Acidobacteriaceae bacterium]